MSKKRVIIVGGGFAGLDAAKNLTDNSFEVTIIDKLNHHLFQPLLYQVATGALSPGDIAAPIRQIFVHQKNISCVMATVTAIDKEKKEVILQNNNRLPFDYLILAPGSTHTYFGHDPWEKYAKGLKTIRDALEIREHILSSLEKADQSTDTSEIEKLLTFVVIGAGPTGVELAGAISEIALQSVYTSYKNIDTRKAKIILIDAANRILPTYPEDLANYAKKEIESMNIEIMTSTNVLDINQDCLKTDKGTFYAKTIIWSAGCKASSLIDTLNIPQDKMGRALVQKDLSIPNHSEIFVIGDSACCMIDGKPLPGVASVAKQQGSYVASIIQKNLLSHERPDFTYTDKGTMATIGRGKAIALINGHEFSGFFAWVAWCFIHIFFLIGFSNRISVFVRWSTLYLTSKRQVMLITRPLNTVNKG